MTNDLLSACFPVINRPEYPKQPEWLQASLAWRMAGDDLVQQEDDGKLVGFVFREREKTTSKKVKMVETRPNPAGSLWEALCRAGVVDVPGLSAQHVCETLLDAMEGVNPAKAKAFGAVPLVPACAFLQDAVGVHAKTNPPDFGLIVEQAYRAGNREIVAENEASCLYWKALAHVLSDPMMASLNSALSEHLCLVGCSAAADAASAGRPSRHYAPRMAGDCPVALRMVPGCMEGILQGRMAQDTASTPVERLGLVPASDRNRNGLPVGGCLVPRGRSRRALGRRLRAPRSLRGGRRADGMVARRCAVVRARCEQAAASLGRRW